MRFRKGFAMLLMLLGTACGGSTTAPSSTSGSSGSTGGGGGGTVTPPNGTLTFRVDGTASSASSITASFANGILSVGGTDSSRATTLSFAIAPTSAGTGTYTFAPLNAGNASIMIGNPASGWQAGVGIGSGTVTVNSLTSTAASGTFSFSMVAVGGTGASGTKSVTDGTFNVTFSAPTAPPPTPSGGSTMSVLIDGVQWTSSLTRRATLTGNILSITGQDTSSRVITLAVPIGAGLQIPPAAPTTVSLDFTPGTHGVVSMVLGVQNWDNGHAGGAGSFTITGISATRVSGTFTVTLVNNPINVVPVPTVRLTSGTFDMALERF